MEIQSVEIFCNYYRRVKKRTQNLFPFIPEDKLEWTYQEGKFTIGDVIRHMACIERNMFAENALFKKSCYDGCGINYANGLAEVIQFYNDKMNESMTIFEGLSMEDLQRKCETPGGIQITLWKWLRAMVEHEIHHRGQLYIYLAQLDITTPPLYGLTSEEVIKRSVTGAANQ